ncbi:hypothetical protein J6590_034910 [Homalodisca vitripennis]|nr:hypothetical protein J6590_034910 [Homalodisca vitripennis]
MKMGMGPPNAASAPAGRPALLHFMQITWTAPQEHFYRYGSPSAECRVLSDCRPQETNALRLNQTKNSAQLSETCLFRHCGYGDLTHSQ